LRTSDAASNQITRRNVVDATRTGQPSTFWRVVTPEQAIDRISDAFGRRTGLRTLHAKGRFYTATFTATSEAGELSRAGHLTGSPVPTVVRLSNGAGGSGQPDRVADVRGIAVSFRPAEGVATDMLAQTAPRFPVRNADDFVALTRAAALLQRQPWLIARFLATHPSAARALAANARAGALKPPRSFASATYYAIHAYRWLDADGEGRWVRYTWLPDPAAGTEAPDRKDPDYLHHDMERRLADGPVRLTLQVQVAADGDDPHDPTSVWRSTKHIDAGVLEITAPDPSRETDGEIIVFDPVRVIDGIELSDDPILRFRPLAYSVSAERRV
jgi:catalase